MPTLVQLRNATWYSALLRCAAGSSPLVLAHREPVRSGTKVRTISRKVISAGHVHGHGQDYPHKGPVIFRFSHSDRTCGPSAHRVGTARHSLNELRCSRRPQADHLWDVSSQDSTGRRSRSNQSIGWSNKPEEYNVDFQSWHRLSSLNRPRLPTWSTAAVWWASR